MNTEATQPNSHDQSIFPQNVVLKRPLTAAVKCNAVHRLAGTTNFDECSKAHLLSKEWDDNGSDVKNFC